MTAVPGEVQSVTRALKLLSCLAAAHGGQRLTDLARSSGLAVSTVHRLLLTMQQAGFVHFDSSGNDWHVGRQAFSAGAAYVSRRSYVAPALILLRRLRDETRETASLGVLDNGQLVTLAQVESRERAHAIPPAGGRVAAVCSAMGKALLATWPEQQVEAFCNHAAFHRMVGASRISLSALMHDLAEVRKRGYAVDDEKYTDGLCCVAAAVWSPQGEAVCAVSVTALASRLSGEGSPDIASAVMRAADDLTRRIGGPTQPGAAGSSRASRRQLSGA